MKNGIKTISLTIMCALVMSSSVCAMNNKRPQNYDQTAEYLAENEQFIKQGHDIALIRAVCGGLGATALSLCGVAAVVLGGYVGGKVFLGLEKKQLGIACAGAGASFFVGGYAACQSFNAASSLYEIIPKWARVKEAVAYKVKSFLPTCSN